MVCFVEKIPASLPRWFQIEVLHQPVEVCIHPTVAILLAIWKSLTTSSTVGQPKRTWAKWSKFLEEFHS